MWPTGHHFDHANLIVIIHELYVSTTCGHLQAHNTTALMNIHRTCILQLTDNLLCTQLIFNNPTVSVCEWYLYMVTVINRTQQHSVHYVIISVVLFNKSYVLAG
jgi:hypothetical protein